jgi:hypothetical protein
MRMIGSSRGGLGLRRKMSQKRMSREPNVKRGWRMFNAA